MSLAYAEESKVYIDVGQAQLKQSVLAFPPFNYVGTQNANTEHVKIGIDLFQVVGNDLEFSNLFTKVLPKAYPEDPAKVGVRPAPGEPTGFSFEKWKLIGTEFMIRAAYYVSESQITLDGYLYYVPQSKLIVAKTYHGPVDSSRRIAHYFANDIIQALTGKPGMYLTKLVASRQEVTNNKEAYKEIMVMDYDGANSFPITSDKTISLSPTWSNKGDKIAYSSYALHTQSKLRNVDLFIYELNTRKRLLVSYKKGINSGAAFMPGDEHILLTLSKGAGVADIYKINIDGTDEEALTKGPNGALNVEPAISPDGKTIAFSSDRAGRPMIYTMDANGKNQKRLNMAITGQYNSTPAWSPDGKSLALAILDKDHFDIFTVNADGTNLKRLTDAKKLNGKPANNESPTWSPDGTHIAFVSDRVDGKQVYIINADGLNERRVTRDKAIWDRPKWSPFLK